MSRIRLTDRPRPDLAKLAARESGLPKFLGSPCKRGHIGIRYSKTGHCTECANFNRDNKEIVK